MAVASIAAPSTIVKRDGRVVPFVPEKIFLVIEKAFSTSNEELPPGTLVDLTERVVNLAAIRASESGIDITVEGCQDIVEIVLQSSGYYQVAKHFILYRHQRSEIRRRPIPLEVTEAFRRSDIYFPTDLQKFQFFDKYSRFDYDLGRRQTWEETVDRTVSSYYSDIIRSGNYHRLPSDILTRIRHGMLNMQAMPSMRRLAMSGPAYDRDNAVQYNCTYLPVDCLEAFVEGLILTMDGCGVGFSVESSYVDQLPRIKRQHLGLPIESFVVEDTTEGWGNALRHGLDRWVNGFDIRFDVSLIRPSGAPLRIKGGRASGPEPLQKMFEFIRRRILARQGNVLRPIDAHDIMCKVGSAAISGGVRRMAMISLFDEDDHEMLNCKSGDFEKDNDQRWNANNSMVWSTPPDLMDQAAFTRRMLTMVESGRGEPGIFGRWQAESMMPDRRKAAWLLDGHSQLPLWGTNPCGEIVLPPNGVCNLTTVPARETDDFDTLVKKIELATIMGTIQSLGIHFPYLRPIWAENAARERLLGVSLSGQLDSRIAQDPEVMDRLRHHAININAEYSAMLGIAPSASITCVKPDGNGSQLLDMSPGIHSRWAPYYIRNVRVASTSPLSRVLADSGVPLSPENGQDPLNPQTWVISFPVAAPSGALTRNDRSALDQCNYWLQNKVHWTEHNPSVTITFQPHEVLDVIKWAWDNRDKIGGMAFLPSYDAKYDQLPYIETSREQYLVLKAAFPSIDFSNVYRYEVDDRTTAAQELACMAGVCEIEEVPAS